MTQHTLKNSPPVRRIGGDSRNAVEAVRQGWSGPPQLLQHFDRIAEATDAIPLLRRFILDLAVRGKPSGWALCSIDELTIDGPQNRVSPKSTKNELKSKAITLSATTRAIFDDKHYKHIDIDLEDDSPFWLKPGDFLFQRGNTRGYVGIAAVYDEKPNVFVYPNLIIRVRLNRKLSLKFIHLAVIAPDAREYFSSQASGTSDTMPKINQTVLRSTPLLLPPLAEQKRIVAKVDELMALCDQLEARLTTTRTESQQLLEACIKEAVA